MRIYGYFHNLNFSALTHRPAKEENIIKIIGHFVKIFKYSEEGQVGVRKIPEFQNTCYLSEWSISLFYLRPRSFIKDMTSNIMNRTPRD